MKTFTNRILAAIAALGLLAGAPAFAQTATPSTTLSAAITPTTQCIPLASNTNVTVGGGLYIVPEYMTVLATPVGSACVPVRRGDVSPVGVPIAAPSGATVYVAVTPSGSTVPGDNGFSYSPSFNPYGPAVRANIPYLPVIKVVTGQIWDCPLSPEAVSPNTCVWRLISNPVGSLYGAAQFVSIPLTLTQLQTLNTVGVKILPAQGAGTLTEILSCTLDLKRGSAAFTGGGTITIGYGATAATTAAAATIASTVLTTFAASQSVLVAGALAVTANTSTLNQPIWMNAASADFAAGTGATGLLDCAYRVHTGM